MSYQVLLGAEFDKVVSLLMVTLILALGLVRARKLLFRAVTDQLAATELSRFFAPEVAGRIRESDIALEPGQAELREAAILMVDLRGFTPLSQQLAPARGHGAAVRVPVAGGRRGHRATAAASTSSWATASSRASARRGRAPTFAADALRAVDDAAGGDRALGRGAARRAALPAPHGRRRGRHGAGDVRHHRRRRAGSSTR